MRRQGGEEVLQSLTDSLRASYKRKLIDVETARESDPSQAEFEMCLTGIGITRRRMLSWMLLVLNCPGAAGIGVG